MFTEDALPSVDLTKDLREMARIATLEDGLEDLLRRGLDWLQRLAPYDLATIFALEGETLVVRMARGTLAGPWARGHKLSLARFPTIREALETRRARAFTENDHAHGDGDPFDGVLDLPPGHSCMVVPLCAGERPFGVLTLDRTRCELYPDTVVNLAEVYAQILALAIANAEQRAALERLHQQDHEHARLLETELRGDGHVVLAESRSEAVRSLARRAEQVAVTNTPVLVLGETGTGKERLSRAIHEWSPRREHPFVSLNCAAVPGGLLESELFGHVRGSFTGATRDRAGRFQMANGGTLFLDEIGEMPQELQSKLLRVLQEASFEPVGGDRTIKVDVRIIAATHVDLMRAIREGKFREDLFYRLNVFPLTMPPLRERKEDIAILCDSLLSDQARRAGRKRAYVTEAGVAKLSRHDWPGNIRELANVLERATILSDSRELGPEVLDLPVRESGHANHEGQDHPRQVLGTLDDAQRERIQIALKNAGGRIYGEHGAAAVLGVKPSTLQSRMKRLGITRSP